MGGSAAMLIAGALASVTAAPSIEGGKAASAQQPAALKPVGPWTANFDDSQCVALRNYGQGSDRMTLVIKLPALGDKFQIGITYAADRSDTYAVDSKIAFDGQLPIPVTLLVFTALKSKQRALIANLPSARLDLLKSASSISFEPGNPRQELLLTGVPQVLQIMDECIQDLRRDWNVNGSAGGKPPKADWNPILQAHFYPGVGDARLFGGAVTVALLLNEVGKVADCTVTESYGAASPGVQACALIAERGKFSPAIGADGKAVKGAILKHLDWRPSKPHQP